MSAAPVERGHGEQPLIAEADRIMERLPGRRVEIIGGQILVTPSPDVAHSRALKKVTGPLTAAGLDDSETEIHQGVGVWLPSGPEDYAIPDLCLVESDIDEYLIANNSYDPRVFRLVLEVTSSNWKTDLQTKVSAYAEAKIPIYVIVDRKHQRLHVLTDPAENDYTTHRIHAPGEIVTLPDSIGAKVSFDVAEILDAGQSKRTP